MRILRRIILLSAALFSMHAAVAAIPVRIVSGELFIGGSAYGTPGYQNYLRFYIVGRTRAPQRSYQMQAEQINAIEVNHPPDPKGEYIYQVRMPNHGSAFGIDDRLFYPVWYDCVWNIRSAAQTPLATADSPQFITVSEPFQIYGSSNFIGALNIGFRVKGQGFSELKFEKTGMKYYIREARYTFTDISQPNSNPLLPGSPP